MANLGRLAGVSCLIVGGTSGIGLASARRFLEEGARLVVTGRTAAFATEEWAFGRALGHSNILQAEVSDASSLAEAFRQAITLLGGRIDVLFHVAGISGRQFGDGPLHECSLDAWDRVLDTNARGVFLSNQLALRQMMVQEPDAWGLRGTIVNTGSVLAHSPSPRFFGTYAYAASKGAIRAMTLCAAARYAGDKIRFNLLSPALIDTPMSQRAVENPAIHAYLAVKQPLGEGAGLPSDCAEAALFLCEPSSRFLTGVELNVDGGWCVSEPSLP